MCGRALPRCGQQTWPGLQHAASPPKAAKDRIWVSHRSRVVFRSGGKINKPAGKTHPLRSERGQGQAGRIRFAALCNPLQRRRARLSQDGPLRSAETTWTDIAQQTHVSRQPHSVGVLRGGRSHSNRGASVLFPVPEPRTAPSAVTAGQSGTRCMAARE